MNIILIYIKQIVANDIVTVIMFWCLHIVEFCLGYTDRRSYFKIYTYGNYIYFRAHTGDPVHFKAYMEVIFTLGHHGVMLTYNTHCESVYFGAHIGNHVYFRA